MNWHERKKNWQVNVSHPGNRIEHIGRYDTEEDAARAYDNVITTRSLDKETNFDQNGVERVLEKTKNTSRYEGVRKHQGKGNMRRE